MRSYYSYLGRNYDPSGVVGNLLPPFLAPSLSSFNYTIFSPIWLFISTKIKHAFKKGFLVLAYLAYQEANQNDEI